MIVLFWYEIIPSCFVYYKLDIPMSSLKNNFQNKFLMDFWKKKRFCLNSVFMSIYSYLFDWIFWLYAFFNTNPWFSACFEVLLWVQNIPFYHTSWLQVFQSFQLSLFLVKIVNHCELHVLLDDIEHWLH